MLELGLQVLLDSRNGRERGVKVMGKERAEATDRTEKARRMTR